ncbi:50S ribosomal protein L32 [Nocardiopsis alkaliphila]
MERTRRRCRRSDPSAPAPSCVRCPPVGVVVRVHRFSGSGGRIA